MDKQNRIITGTYQLDFQRRKSLSRRIRNISKITKMQFTPLESSLQFRLVEKEYPLTNIAITTLAEQLYVHKMAYKVFKLLCDAYQQNTLHVPRDICLKEAGVSNPNFTMQMRWLQAAHVIETWRLGKRIFYALSQRGFELGTYMELL